MQTTLTRNALIDRLKALSSPISKPRGSTGAKGPRKKVSDLLGEIWSTIPDWEGFYQVSNLGRVKSLERLVTCSDGTLKRYSESLMQGFRDAEGEKCVHLSSTELGINLRVVQVKDLMASVSFEDTLPKEFLDVLAVVKVEIADSLLLASEELLAA